MGNEETCQHPNVYREMIGRFSSGDYICPSCGKVEAGRKWETENRPKDAKEAKQPPSV